MKKRWDEQNSKIHEMRDINVSYKDELSNKVKLMTGELERLSEENATMVQQLRDSENKYFQEREAWIEERSKLI